MILVDANLVLYATIRDYPQHLRARRWFEDRLNAPPRVGLPWPTILAFVRITTNARLFPRPLSVTDAWHHVEEWLALPNVWIPREGERHSEIVGRLLRETTAAANLVSDAHLAAIAIEHALILCSSDRDFSRFRDLHWENPLETPAPPTAA